MHWRIWLELHEGNRDLGHGLWYQRYLHKSSAVRRAKQLFTEPRINRYDGKTYTYKWIVSQTNPWKIMEGE